MVLLYSKASYRSREVLLTILIKGTSTVTLQKQNPLEEISPTKNFPSKLNLKVERPLPLSSLITILVEDTSTLPKQPDLEEIPQQNFFSIKLKLKVKRQLPFPPSFKSPQRPLGPFNKPNITQKSEKQN